jgi:hypothetical protein
VIKFRIVRWVGHVIVGDKGEVYTGFFGGKFEGNGHLQDLGIDGK